MVLLQGEAPRRRSLATMGPRTLLAATMVLGSGCAHRFAWTEASARGWANRPPACVGDVVLRSPALGGTPTTAAVERDGDAFAYRGHPVSATLVQPLLEPLVGPLPAEARCSTDTHAIAIDVGLEHWRRARATASTRSASATATTDFRSTLFDLMVELVRIDAEVDGFSIDASPDDDDRPRPVPLVLDSPIRAWTWAGRTPLEIAAQHTTTDRITGHVAEVAAALRKPLPGFEFAYVDVSCHPDLASDCTTLFVFLQGHWRDVQVVLPTNIVHGRVRIADAEAVGELLGSPLAAALLEVRRGRPGFGAHHDASAECIGNWLFYDGYADGFELERDAASGVIELLWPAAASDEVTLALDRLGRWDTIVALSRTHDAPPTDIPASMRRAWLDRDGRWVVPLEH
jgi:hypothetical protein